MAINSNNTYLQYWEDFSLLGKSMKKYAIANWISMAVGFFGAIIIQIVFMAPLLGSMDSSIFDDPYALLLGMGGISIFIIVVVFAISIYQFVTYIKYLMQLKKVGELTNDRELQKAYKMELWAMIISFIMGFIIIPGMFILFLGGGFMNFMMMDEAAFYNFIMLILGLMLVIIIIALISIILQVISVVSLDNWGQNIKITNFQNPYAVNIAEGTSFMKWGRIIALFTGSIGVILYLIGIMKAGSNIIEFFDGYGNNQSIQGGAFPQYSSGNTLQQPGGFTTSPNLNSSSMGNTSYGNTTMKPQVEGFCSFCGSKLEDKNSMFCSNCGRKLF
ncbi:MAG: zinc ribbon domain-containing protein [Promethearchaeota archaeon]